MIPDGELLRDYIENSSEAAFSELVERHLDMVYSTALRAVGDSHRASDVCQLVFTALARNARSIRNKAALSGWLYRTARFTAMRVVRAEARRQRHEAAAVEARMIESEGDASLWPAIAQHIDEAIATLSPLDQDAVALRFFERRSLKEVGAALGLSDDAAQKRVSRALEKIGEHLRARGVVASSASLAASLSTHAVQTAPAGLAVTAGAGALAMAEALTPLTLFFMTLKWKVAIGSVLLMALLGVVTAVVTRRSGADVAQSLQRPPQRAQEKSAPSAKAPQVVGEKSVDEIVAALQKLMSDPNFARRHAAILDLAAGVRMADISEAIGRAEKIEDGRIKTPFIHLLLARLAQTNPTKAVATAQRLSTMESINEGLRTVFDAWGEKDAKGLIAWMREIPLRISRVNESQFAAVQGQAAMALIARDPKGAFAMINSGELGAGMEKTAWYPTIFARWADRDVTSALSAAQELPEGEFRNGCVTAVVNSWAQKDAPAAAAYWEKLPDGPLRNNLISQVATAWATADPERAMEWANSLGDRMDRSRASSWMIEELAWSDPKSAARFLDKAGADFARGYVRPWTVVAEEFAKSDVQGAVKWLNNISDAKLRAAAFESMAAEWAKADPLAAGTFALQMPDVNTIETRLSNRGLNERQQAILMVVQQWSNSDPAAAIRWAAQLPEADQLHGHVVSAAEIWARSNPQEAAQFVAGELKAGPLQEQAASEIVKIWSATDPAAAAQWALQFPEGAAKERAFSGVIADWAKNDVTTAEQFLLDAPVEKIPEEAIASFIVAARQSNPATAAKWLDKIPPGPKREALARLFEP